MHRVRRPTYRYLWRNAVSDQCLHWKYFLFTTIHGWKHLQKTDLYFVKLIMQKVSYIPLENILADDPLQRMSKKVEFSIAEEAVSSRFLINLFEYQLRMSELSWLRSLVKHNVAAKHGSSKPLTSNELWLLGLRIKSTRILAPIPDALRDMCKSSIMLNSKHRHWHMQFQHLTTWASLWFQNGHSLNTTYTMQQETYIEKHEIGMDLYTCR